MHVHVHWWWWWWWGGGVGGEMEHKFSQRQPSSLQERSLTADLLRKLSPREAELLRDPAIQARVKFRLVGYIEVTHSFCVLPCAPSVVCSFFVL